METVTPITWDSWEASVRLTLRHLLEVDILTVSIHRQAHRGSERLGDLPKFTQQGNGGARVQMRVPLTIPLSSFLGDVKSGWK